LKDGFLYKFAKCELVVYHCILRNGRNKEMADLTVVEFVIRLSELRKATKRLLFNRGEFKETDCADLLVSPCAATFRTVGAWIDVPVSGNSPGTVRMPLRMLEGIAKVASTYKKPELRLHFEAGKIQVEKFSLRHPDVALGIFPDQRVDLPADAGVLDTLALASLLSPEQIFDQGLRERVETAQRFTSGVVSRAEEALREFSISREGIQNLVDVRIKETAAKLGTEGTSQPLMGVLKRPA
jgi:hypothetical protein